MKSIAILVFVIIGTGWFALGPICSSFGKIGEREARRYANDNRELAEEIPTFPGSRLIEESENDCEGTYRKDAGSSCFLMQTFETRREPSEAQLFFDDFFEANGWRLKYPSDSIYRLYTKDDFLVQISPIRLTEYFADCPDSAIGGPSTQCVEAEMQRRVLAGVRADDQPWSFTIDIQHLAEWPPWPGDDLDDFLP